MGDVSDPPKTRLKGSKLSSFTTKKHRRNFLRRFLRNLAAGHRPKAVGA